MTDESDAFKPVDPESLQEDLDLDTRLAEYLATWENVELKDVPEEQIIEGGREQLIRAFPTAVTELIKIMKFGSKDDATRASVGKFIVLTVMRDPVANGDDRASKLLNEMMKEQ